MIRAPMSERYNNEYIVVITGKFDSYFSFFIAAFRV
jgi:hypothetical protein